MRKVIKLSHLLLAALLLSACNLPTSGSTAQPTNSQGVVQTAAAQTVQALQTQLATAQPPTQEAATEEPAATGIPTAAVATSAPPTVAPPPPTVAPTAKPVPCDRAGFVSDVTIPDGTSFAANAAFTKTWRLRNDGSCSWTTSYKLVFDSGDAMSGPAAVALAGNVNPGQTVDLSVNLKAPATPKSEYKGNWKLENASGKKFGVGSNADQPFWVSIAVGGTPGTPGAATPTYFAVTKVATTATVENTDSCPRTVTFQAAITVSKAGTISYQWISSDGSTSKAKNLTFDAAGTKTVTTTLQLGDSGNNDGWEQIYIDNPNHQAFSKAQFSFDCP